MALRSRREFLQSALAASVSPGFAIAKPNRNDVRIRHLSFAFEDFPYRASYSFGGRSVDRVTLLNVNCAVEDGTGRVSHGFGSMPLGNVWSFPSERLAYDATLGAMKALAKRIAKNT